MISDQIVLSNFITPEKLNVSRETFDKIEIYINLLKKWNKSINLTSRKLLDAHLVKYIKEAVFLGNILDKSSKIIDLGSGNGLPGIILSILNFNIILVERNIKKVIFLKEVIRHLNLSAQVINDDIRDSYKVLLEYHSNYIVSKAVSRASDIINLCLPIITNVTEFYLLKNLNMLNEIEILKEKYNFESVIIENKYVDDSVILKIKSLKLK